LIKNIRQLYFALAVLILVSIGIYYLMSPYQNCMRDQIYRDIAESMSFNPTQEDADAYLKKLCREVARDQRKSWF